MSWSVATQPFTPQPFTPSTSSLSMPGTPAPPPIRQRLQGARAALIQCVVMSESILDALAPMPKANDSTGKQEDPLGAEFLADDIVSLTNILGERLSIIRERLG